MSNPFLELHKHISWSKCTINQAKIDIPTAISHAKQSLQELKSKPPSYENTIMGFELLLTPLYRGWSVLQHLNSVNGTEESRNAIQELLPKIITFSSELYVDAQLWDMIQKAEESSNDINEIQKKHIEETKVEFIKNGALLSDVEKKNLVEIDQELGKITQQYANNMLKDRLAFEKLISDEELLQGIPQNAKDAALQLAISKEYAAKDNPKWLFTLDMPSFLPIQKFADNASLREEMFRSILEVGRSEEHNNMPIIKNILKLRRDKAQLLGYKNFPDMVLEKRMAQNGENALAFIEDLFEKSKAQFDKEVLELQKYKKNFKGGQNVELNPWDVLYYQQKMEQEYHQFNDEVLRPYFSLPKVMQGFCDLANDLYGIRIQEIDKKDLSTDGHTEIEVWHETVKAYEIYDMDDSYIGRFYADFFPREGKRGGAWMNSLHNRVPGSPFQSQIGLICANVTPSLDGGSAQLNHREVQTVFHEMGHLLHHMLGEIDIPSLNGTSVAWDFVELPSQIMENWCWEKDFLQHFAVHSETNEILSDEIFEKLNNKRTFLSAMMMMRQLKMGIMDLKLHLYDGDLDNLELDNFIQNQTKNYNIPCKDYNLSNIARFPHLFSGPVAYAAGYYSYKWAEVLDADAFSRFKEEGICSREVGLSFRKEILSKGKSQSPEQLFENFMGRKPNPNALLERDNLL